MATKKYLSLERLTEYDELIKGEIADGDASTLASAKSYTDTEVAKKANSSHTHDDRYYTETEIDSKFSDVNTSIGNITSGTTTVKKAEQATSATTASTASNAEKLGGQLPSYYAKASDIPTGALADKSVVSESDLDSALAEKVNAAAEGNHSHSNKTVLDGITSAKVSAWSSAEENAKAYADSVGAAKADKTHNHDADYDAIGSADTALGSAKTYTDEKISALLDGADDTTLDSIKELADAIKTNDSAIDALNDVAAGKQATITGAATTITSSNLTASRALISNSSGKVAVSAVTTTELGYLDGVTSAIQTQLDAKVPTSRTINNKALTGNISLTYSDVGAAPSSHTHDVYVNQNAFSNIKVGETTIAADTTTDTLELVGTNVTITPDETNDKVPIAVASGSTSTAGILKLTNSTSSTSTTTAATPSAVKSAYDLANTANTAAGTAQTRADAAYTLAEGKVDSLSDLSITATATELNYMDGVTSNVQTQLDGKAASSHGNHVPTTQTANNATFLRNDNTWQKVTPANIGAAASSHTHTISDITNLQTTLNNASSAISANTSTISEHTTAISNLQTAVSEIQEITSQEIQSLFSA